MNKDISFPERDLPKGIKLKILTPDEVEKNLRERPREYWVINVLSSPQKERIIPHVIRLIDNGYPVYITRAKVKGKDWMRLRIGFFSQKKDADKEGKNLMERLNFSDVWTTKTGDMEFGEFGGY